MPSFCKRRITLKFGVVTISLVTFSNSRQECRIFADACQVVNTTTVGCRGSRIHTRLLGLKVSSASEEGKSMLTPQMESAEILFGALVIEVHSA